MAINGLAAMKLGQMSIFIDYIDRSIDLGTMHIFQISEILMNEICHLTHSKVITRLR